MYTVMYDFLISLVNGSVNFTNFLFTPIWNGLSPIMLIGFSGLSAYLVVAVTKWLIS